MRMVHEESEEYVVIQGYSAASVLQISPKYLLIV